jgi:hypothetical protein
MDQVSLNLDKHMVIILSVVGAFFQSYPSYGSAVGAVYKKNCFN